MAHQVEASSAMDVGPSEADELTEKLKVLKGLPISALRVPETLEWMLLAFAAAPDGRQLDDLRYLVESALDGRDGLATLRSELATRFFAMGLGAAHPAARRLACEQLARLATPDDVRALLASGAVARLANLVADASLPVAHAAAGCLVTATAACSAAGLEPSAVLTSPLLATLAELCARPGRAHAAVRLRALELSAHLALGGEATYAACADAGLLQSLLAAWRTDDLLERLAVLELLLQLGRADPARGLALLVGGGAPSGPDDGSSSSGGGASAAAPPPAGATHSPLGDVLADIQQCVDGSHPDPLAAALLLPISLAFVGELAAAGELQLAAVRAVGATAICAAALAAAPSDEVAAAALGALGALGSCHGATALAELLGQTRALETVCELARGGGGRSRAIRAAAIGTLARLLDAAVRAGDARAAEAAALEAAAHACVPSGAEATLARALLALASGLDEPTRAAGLALLRALAASGTGGALVACCEPVVSWLANAAAFQAPTDLEAKRAIARALLAQPVAAAQLSEAARAALAALDGRGGARPSAGGGGRAPNPPARAAVADAQAMQ